MPANPQVTSVLNGTEFGCQQAEWLTFQLHRLPNRPVMIEFWYCTTSLLYDLWLLNWIHLKKMTNWTFDVAFSVFFESCLFLEVVTSSSEIENKAQLSMSCWALLGGKNKWQLVNEILRLQKLLIKQPAARALLRRPLRGKC